MSKEQMEEMAQKLCDEFNKRRGKISMKDLATAKEQPNFCKYCGQALLPAYSGV